MKRYFVMVSHAPFVALGFVFQLMAGGFYAGRIMASRWMTSIALDTIIKRVADEKPVRDTDFDRVRATDLH